MAERNSDSLNRENTSGLSSIGGPGRSFGGSRMVPVVKAKNFKGTMLRLWKYFGRERAMLSIVFLLVAASTGFALVGPYLIGQAIDAMSKGISAVEFGILWIILISLTASYIGEALVGMLQGWLMAGVSQRIVKNMRKTLFAKLQKLPIAFFDKRTHGELMSRLSNDMENVSSSISQATIQLMTSVLTVVGALILMLIKSPLLTLVSFIVIPMVFTLTRTIAKRTSSLFKEQQAVLGRLNGHIEETISGLQIVKAFNHEEKAVEEFEDINNKLCEVGLKAQIWSGYIMPIMNVINNFGFAAVAGVGGAMAVNGMITVGGITMFLSLSRQFARPLNEIANIYNQLQSAMAGAERVFEILDETEEPEDTSDAVKLENPKGHVVFEDVSFGYRPDVPVIKDINFEAPEGSNTALVGPTGAGKTTIVNLLVRFYDVTSGKILIDGRDIREYSRDSLRKCFGIVLQDTYLFSGTIRDNIMYGRPEATEEEMKQAAAMSNADVFIKRLPKGYDTMLQESGSNLSQGQRQLLAIARAILANPSILILDEATSSVDTRTELHIQEAMLKLMNGRTSFIIAHRLSTIRDADTIMVIDGGKIQEKGSHDELLGSDGVYHKLYYSQFKREEES